MKITALIICLCLTVAAVCSCADSVKSDKSVSYETTVNETASIPETAPDDTAPYDTAPNDTAPDDTAPETEPCRYENGEKIYLDMSWRFSDFAELNDGAATMYVAEDARKGIVVAVNAGHGTKDGKSVQTYCHPDKTPKVTGGTTAEGSLKAVGVSTGMAFNDGAYERDVNLQVAQLLRDKLLAKGYDVLMIRDGDDVRLDNVARTVIANNTADCHIAIHWDGDSLDYDKGAFFISVPDGIKYLDNVAATWEEDERLGRCLIEALRDGGSPIRGDGSSDIDLTQTSYSTVPTVDIELGNQCSDHSGPELDRIGNDLARGVDAFFGE